jgi:release factor glutamine methyltransferase
MVEVSSAPNPQARCRPPTLREALTLAAIAGLPVLEARMLLSHVTGFTRTQLITRDNDHLDAPKRDAFATLLARRLTGEPMAYLIGEREFFGRTFRVTPDVLIPARIPKWPPRHRWRALPTSRRHACWIWARARASWP